MKKYKAFTLAETMIVLIVMGIIITISMPTIVKNYSKSVNRTKIKKDMALYSNAIHSMYEGQGFTKKTAFLTWASSAPNCANTKIYFNRSDTDPHNDCIFKTVDGTWWDITNIDNPIIMLKQQYINCLNGSTDKCSRETLEQLSKTGTNDDTNVFTMSFQIDENTGMLHVNDKVFEEGILNNEANRYYMTKLFSFIYEKDFTSDVNIPDIGDISLNQNVNTNVAEPEVTEFEPKLCKNDDGSLCSGWINGNNCANTIGTVVLCNYQNGYATESKYCRDGANATTDDGNLPQTILNTNTGEKIMFSYNNGALKEVQYVKDNLVEVYQINGSKKRVAKYNYDDDNLFKQSWWINAENNNYTWSQFQYYDADTNKYYLFSISPQDQNSTKYVVDGTRNWASDKPFTILASEQYTTTGTKATVSSPGTVTRTSLAACASGCSNNIMNILYRAFNEGYFDQPADKSSIATLNEIDKISEHNLSNLNNYQKYICNK